MELIDELKYVMKCLNSSTEYHHIDSIQEAIDRIKELEDGIQNIIQTYEDAKARYLADGKAVNIKEAWFIKDLKSLLKKD